MVASKSHPLKRGLAKIWAKCKDNWKILLLIIIVDLAACFNAVSFKLSADALRNYPYFMSLVSLVVYIVVFTPMFLVQNYVTKTIDPSVFKFPLRNYFYLSILLAFAHVLLYSSTPHVAGPTLSLLQQSTLVIQFIIAIVIFKKKFGWLHYLSVLLVCAGIVVFFMPSILHDTPSNGSSSDHESGGVTFFWEISIIGWSILWAANNAAFEKILMNYSPSTAWLNIWVSLFCLPIDAAIVWVVLAFQKKSLWYEIYYGAQCLFLGHTSLGGEDDIYCKDAFYLWIVYSAMSNLVSLLSLWSIMMMGAAVSSLTSVIVLPATNMLFASRGLLKDQATPFDKYTIIALVIITVGMFMFGGGDFITEKKKKKDRRREDKKGW